MLLFFKGMKRVYFKRFEIEFLFLKRKVSYCRFQERNFKFFLNRELFLLYDFLCENFVLFSKFRFNSSSSSSSNINRSSNNSSSNNSSSNNNSSSSSVISLTHSTFISIIYIQKRRKIHINTVVTLRFQVCLYSPLLAPANF